jgi:hypothetical protein
MGRGKAKVLPSTQFPRHWVDKEVGVKFTVQPYVVGLYIAATKINTNSTPMQGTIDYSDLRKFIKKLQKDEKVTDLVLSDLGDYLSTSDLELINS